MANLKLAQRSGGLLPAPRSCAPRVLVCLGPVALAPSATFPRKFHGRVPQLSLRSRQPCAEGHESLRLWRRQRDPRPGGCGRQSREGRDPRSRRGGVETGAQVRRLHSGQRLHYRVLLWRRGGGGRSRARRHHPADGREPRADRRIRLAGRLARARARPAAWRYRHHPDHRDGERHRQCTGHRCRRHRG